MHATLRWTLAGALSLSATVLAAEDKLPKTKTDTGKPAWQRLLRGDDARKAASLAKQIAELERAQKWAAARKAAEELARLRAEKQARDHWQAVDARWHAAELMTVERAPAEIQRAYGDSLPLWERAQALSAERPPYEHPYYWAGFVLVGDPD